MAGNGEDSADEMMDVLLGNAPKNQGNNPFETGILFGKNAKGVEDVLDVPVTAAKKLAEDKVREAEIEEVELEIKAL